MLATEATAPTSRVHRSSSRSFSRTKVPTEQKRSPWKACYIVDVATPLDVRSLVTAHSPWSAAGVAYESTSVITPSRRCARCTDCFFATVKRQWKNGRVGTVEAVFSQNATENFFDTYCIYISFGKLAKSSDKLVALSGNTKCTCTCIYCIARNFCGIKFLRKCSKSLN